MTEGNEQTPEAPFDESKAQENVSATETEEERHIMLIIILIGLLGIAAFMGWLLYTDRFDSGSLFGKGDIVNPNAPIVENEDGTKNIGGRNITILGLGLMGNDAFFVDPDLGMTLYVNDGSCTKSCLIDWVPYIGTRDVTDGLLTSEPLPDKSFHYAWNGQKLYLYTKDQPGQFLGVGNGWSIVKP